jgi:hypothetical protein
MILGALVLGISLGLSFGPEPRLEVRTITKTETKTVTVPSSDAPAQLPDACREVLNRLRDVAEVTEVSSKQAGEILLVLQNLGKAMADSVVAVNQVTVQYRDAKDKMDTSTVDAAEKMSLIDLYLDQCLEETGR